MYHSNPTVLHKLLVLRKKFQKYPKKMLILFFELVVETQVMPMMIFFVFSLLYEEYQR